MSAKAEVEVLCNLELLTLFRSTLEPSLMPLLDLWVEIESYRRLAGQAEQRVALSRRNQRRRRRRRSTSISTSPTKSNSTNNNDDEVAGVAESRSSGHRRRDNSEQVALSLLSTSSDSSSSPSGSPVPLSASLASSLPMDVVSDHADEGSGIRSAASLSGFGAHDRQRPLSSMLEDVQERASHIVETYLDPGSSQFVHWLDVDVVHQLIATDLFDSGSFDAVQQSALRSLQKQSFPAFFASATYRDAKREFDRRARLSFEASIVDSRTLRSGHSLRPSGPSPKRTHTVYIIEANSLGLACRRQWTIARRYSEFRTLDLALRTLFPIAMEQIPFPPKKAFGKFKEAFIAGRRQQLSQYLSTIGRVSDICMSAPYLLFFEAKQHLRSSPAAGSDDVIVNFDDKEGRRQVGPFSKLKAVASRRSSRHHVFAGGKPGGAGPVHNERATPLNPRTEQRLSARVAPFPDDDNVTGNARVEGLSKNQFSDGHWSAGNSSVSASVPEIGGDLPAPLILSAPFDTDSIFNESILRPMARDVSSTAVTTGTAIGGSGFASSDSRIDAGSSVQPVPGARFDDQPELRSMVVGGARLRTSTVGSRTSSSATTIPRVACPFDNLPPSIELLIMCCLANRSSLHSASMVCHRWSRLAWCASVWPALQSDGGPAWFGHLQRATDCVLTKTAPKKTRNSSRGHRAIDHHDNDDGAYTGERSESPFAVSSWQWPPSYSVKIDFLDVLFPTINAEAASAVFASSNGNLVFI